MAVGSHKTEVIHASRISLRPFAESDREAMKALFSDAEVGKTYLLPDFATEEEKDRLFDRISALSLRPDRLVWAISKDGAAIGILNEVERSHGSIEFGYALLPAFWNCGYMTEALKAAVPEAFRMGFTEVVCGYFEDNLSSSRVMEKVGMLPLGREDSVFYRGAAHRVLYRGIRRAEG